MSEVVADVDVGAVIPVVATHRIGAGKAAAILRPAVGVGVARPGEVDPGHHRHRQELRAHGEHLRVVPGAFVFHHSAVIAVQLDLLQLPQPWRVDVVADVERSQAGLGGDQVRRRQAIAAHQH